MKITLVVAALLVAAVSSSSILLTPRHNSTKDWYETATFYQIYPRSFADSDGDGVGDIKGIISKLPHLKDLGVTSTWLSPIFKSPMADFGYDISDFYDVDPTFGTMIDLENLFAEAAKLDIKIILDFVPNHSSDQCEWFLKSVQRDPIYADYYVWNDGIVDPSTGVRRPPNNWNSVFYGSAWTFHPVRQQYYLHQFVKEQPDLNYRNPAVVAQMQDVLLFWLRKGAAGFRVDAINHMFEVADLRDEPINDDRDVNAYGYTHKHYTKDLDETYDVVFDWRTLLDDYQRENGGYTRIMMTEAYANVSKTVEFYGKNGRVGSHMPFNFVLIERLNSGSTANDFLHVITEWLDVLPDGKVTNWVMGNHDQPRVGSRYGPERIDALLTLVMTLPGIAVTYQGEEIGMVDNRDGITYEQTVDPQGKNLGPDNFKWASRDPVRTPFQWDASNNHAGFSNGTTPTWLPVHPNYKWLNLAAQKQARHSTYKLYKQLMALRHEDSFIDGSFEPAVVNDNVLTYVRDLDDHEAYLVLINFGEIEQTVNVTSFTNKFPKDRLEVVVGGANTFYQTGDFVDTSSVYLRKNEVIVVKSSSSAITASITLLLFVVAKCFAL